MDRMLSLFGILGLIGVAWLLSVDRRHIKWRPVLWGVGLQLGLAVIILGIPGLRETLFSGVDSGVKTLLSFSQEGADFLFQTVRPHEVTLVDPATGATATQVFVGEIAPSAQNLAFWVLTTVIFFSALMAVLYHYGVMQWFVTGFARVMVRTLGTSGAETLSAAANIFVGQTEAPLVIRPYVSKMTRSELNAVMVGGFATVAGGVLAMYVAFLQDIPGIAGHLLTASLLSAPAALAVAKIMVPETEQPVTGGAITYKHEKLDVNGLEALTRGTLEGLKLFGNIAAMLLVFLAFVAMLNAILGGIGGAIGWDLSIEGILGYLFAPLAFLMGIPWDEALQVGVLLGKKITMTELIAFMDLGVWQSDPATALSDRSAVVASYALCGFANFASVGIQIGGIGGIAPERRADLAQLGLRAMVGGTLAAMMTGNVAGMFYGL